MQSSSGFDGKLTGDHKIPINRLGESVGNKTFGTDNSLVSVCHPLLVTMLSNNHVSDTDPWTEMKMLAWISTDYTGSQFPTGLQNFKSYCI